MGRGATKAAGNRWYQARIKASKYNEKLCSREGAAECLHMSVDAVTDAELGLSKVMPVDKAVLMSDLYGDPSLVNYYCLHECPIGRNLPISDEVPDIDRITVSLLTSKRVGEMSRLEDRLLKIAEKAESGELSDEELDALESIVEKLERFSVKVSKLRNVLENERAKYGRDS